MQTFVKVFTHQEIIYRISMCAHNENCGFMRTYIPCNIGGDEKVSLTKKKKVLKHGWIKETLTFTRCSLSFRLSLFFHCSTSGVAPHNNKGQYQWRTLQLTAYLPSMEQSWTKREIKVNDFPSLWFFKTPASNEWNSFKGSKYFCLQKF